MASLASKEMKQTVILIQYNYSLFAGVEAASLEIQKPIRRE